MAHEPKQSSEAVDTPTGRSDEPDTSPCSSASDAAQPSEPDVFEQARIVRERVARARLAGQDVSLIRSLDAVLDVLLDADVTYSIIYKDEGCSPMMVERDALVRALYTGKHEVTT